MHLIYLKSKKLKLNFIYIYMYIYYYFLIIKKLKRDIKEKTHNIVQIYNQIVKYEYNILHPIYKNFEIKKTFKNFYKLNIII